MSADECKTFVKNCNIHSALNLAMSRDGGSGGSVRMVTLRTDGSFEREYFPPESLTYRL